MSSDQPTNEDKELYVTIWAKVVDTQMHFNEMAVKSRQFGLAFVAAALGLGIVLLVRKDEFSLPIPWLFGGFYIHATVIVVFASAVALHAVRILDLSVYHKMLRGAVAFGEDFEENYMKKIFALSKGMTQAISHFSRHEDAKARRSNDGKYVYEGKALESALYKIQRFYNFTTGALCVAGVVLFVATANFGNIKLDGTRPSIPAARAQ